MSAMVQDKESTQARGDGGGNPERPPRPAGDPNASAEEARQTQTQPQSELATPPKRMRGERLRRPLMIGVPILAIAGGLYFYLTSGRYQSTDDAYVRAAQVSISTNVPGRVNRIEVHDNQHVHRGETLFQLDPRPYRIAVAAARARLAGARLHVRALKADYRQRLADLASARSTVAYADREYKRQERLLKNGITSQSHADRARLALKQAEESFSADRGRIGSALAKLNGNPNLPMDKNPSIQQAQAALDHALLDLSYTVIKAPLDGIVTRVDQLQVGDYIKTATPVFALVSTGDVWIRANFKEVQLPHMRVGQHAKVWIDAYPGRTFQGRVVSLSPGTGADFSLLPPQNATGNWVKVVQRLPVRIALEGRVPGDLASGLSATVEVDTRYHRSWIGTGSTHRSATVARASE